VLTRSNLYFRKGVIRWEPTARDTQDVGEVGPKMRIYQGM
jgi:hypothetical protein